MHRRRRGRAAWACGVLGALALVGAASGARAPRCAAEDDGVARGRALVRSASLEDRVEGVRLLAASNAVAGIQPLEDLIRQNVREMEKQAKLLDPLDAKFEAALGLWERAKELGDPDLLRAVDSHVAAVKREWDVKATHLTALLYITVYAGESFAEFTAPAAVAAVEQGARTEPDALVRQWYVRGLSGLRHRASAPVLLKLLGAADPMTRTLAARALAPAVLDRAVFDALAAATKDKAWPVRLAAIQGVGGAPLDHAVPVLVEAAQREKAELARAADAVLRSLLGVGFPDDPRAWGPWWAEHGASVREGTWARPAEPPPPPSTTRETFFSIPVESENVVFVLDLSGSMSEDLDFDDPRNREVRAELGLPDTRAGVAKAETARAVRGLPDGAVFNLVVFADKARRFSPRPVVASAGTRASAVGWVVRQKLGWLTNVWDGLRSAFDDVYAQGGSATRFTDLPDTVILLSDGLPSRGRFQASKALRDLVLLWNRPVGARVHTVGIGDGQPKELLAELARVTGGAYRDVLDPKGGLPAARPGVPPDLVVAATAVVLERARAGLADGADEALRVESVRALVRVCDWHPDALDLAAAALADPSENVRLAAEGLGAVSPPFAGKVVEKVLPHLSGAEHGTLDAAASALRVLAATGAAAAPAVPVLARLVAAAESGHRVAAAQVLGAVGPAAKAAVPALLAAKAAPDAPPELAAAVDAALARIRR